MLLDRQALRSPELGVELASALFRLYPENFNLDEAVSLIGSRRVVEEIRSGVDSREIAYRWQQALQEFRRNRAKYLLY